VSWSSGSKLLLHLLMEVYRRAAKITSNLDKKTSLSQACQGHTCPLKRAKRQPKPLKRLFSILAGQACGTRPSVAMTPSLGTCLPRQRHDSSLPRAFKSLKARGLQTPGRTLTRLRRSGRADSAASRSLGPRHTPGPGAAAASHGYPASLSAPARP
jgi:hypothetical protein